MTYYNIHTHERKENEISILNVFPQEWKEDETGYISCGIHPWYVEPDQSYECLESIVRLPNVLAIGETGYDSLRGPSLDKQQACFEKHIELSEYYNKPLIIHCVKAWDWLLASHKRCMPKQRWIVHGFRGNPELAQQLLSKGMMLSLGYNFNVKALQIIPADKFLCETDDSGINIEDVYKKIASVWGVTLEFMEKETKKTFKDVFMLSK